MVNVQKSPLRSFQQNFPVGFDCLLNRRHGILNVRFQIFARRPDFGKSLVGIQSCRAQRNIRFIIGRGFRAEMFFKTRLVGNFHGTQTRPRHFGGIRRTDAAHGCADFLARIRLHFLESVQQFVPGHDQMTAGGNLQFFHGNAAGGQTFHFLFEFDGINHHPVADNAVRAGMQNTGWYQVKNKFF